MSGGLYRASSSYTSTLHSPPSSSCLLHKLLSLPLLTTSSLPSFLPPRHPAPLSTGLSPKNLTLTSAELTFPPALSTILLFEDQTVISALQEKLPTYAQKFPEWSGHAHGILAANLWTALEVEGFGANLQHYNPLIDAKVAAEWEIPASWTLTAQLVFGKNEGGPAGEKEFKSLEERVKVFGARL